ncbi:hypothetical protein [Staphylococcus aureus]
MREFLAQAINGSFFHFSITLLLSLIHISEPTRHAQISYAVFCLKKPIA